MTLQRVDRGAVDIDFAIGYRDEATEVSMSWNSFDLHFSIWQISSQLSRNCSMTSNDPFRKETFTEQNKLWNS